MQTSAQNIILTTDDIRKKLERIAYEIYENNYNETIVHLIGITNVGLELAERLQSILQQIAPFEVSVNSIFLDKKLPHTTKIAFKRAVKKLDNQVVILVDDVCNSGRTLCYAIKPLLKNLPSKIEIAVLVNRQYKSFPIIPKYVGLQVSTTLQNYVRVELDAKGEDAVYLA
ncbi:MAG: phosphoribosyltransferase family protein [Chitinophagales bacterium]